MVVVVVAKVVDVTPDIVEVVAPGTVVVVVPGVVVVVAVVVVVVGVDLAMVGVAATRRTVSRALDVTTRGTWSRRPRNGEVTVPIYLALSVPRIRRRYDWIATRCPGCVSLRSPTPLPRSKPRPRTQLISARGATTLSGPPSWSPSRRDGRRERRGRRQLRPRAK